MLSKYALFAKFMCINKEFDFKQTSNINIQTLRSIKIIQHYVYISIYALLIFMLKYSANMHILFYNTVANYSGCAVFIVSIGLTA